MVINYFYFLVMLMLFATPLQKEAILKKDLVITKEEFSLINFDLKLTANQEGELIVAAPDVNSIYLFSKKGSKEKMIGSSGRGPGEFSNLTDIYLDQKDRLNVLDRNLGKVTIYSPPNYHLKRELHVPLNINYQKPENIFVAQNEFLISYAKILSLQNPKQGNRTLYAIDSSGEAINDTIFTVKDNQKFVYKSANKIATLQVPFGYQSLLKMGSKNKIFWGKTDRNIIEVYNKSGKQVQKIAIQQNSVKIPPDTLNKFEQFAASDSPKAFLFKELLDANVIPEVFPVFDWFVIDDKNHIWVAVNTEDQDQYSLRIYNSNGKLINTSTLSKSVEIQSIKNGYAYGIQKEGIDRQSIVRYKVNID